MPSTQTKKKKYTYQDYLNTPDEERWQLINGELFRTPSPNTCHQSISRNLEYELETHVRRTGCGKVFDAPFDVVLDQENVVQPDVLFVAADRKDIITPGNIQGAPDLVVEILSQSSAYHDLVTKKKLYAAAGVKEYWLLDPMEKQLEVLVLETGKGSFRSEAVYGKTDTLQSPLLPELRIKLDTVFEEPLA